MVIEGAANFSSGERAVRLSAGVILPFLIAGFPEEFVYRSLPPLIAAHWGVDVLPAVISFLGIDY